ncbi:unnamed protein product [Lactuca virosa]|uniref:Mediator complex subunit 15 KIX domain-containing protein n=1 Tax=Lactuca virosa TaxID=75947 RepID=A0AAU9ML17_9ASTR|nr:unnamed protein product [Lactuca virosa]
MDMSNLRRTHGGSGDVGDSSLQSGDWRTQLRAAARERMVNRIMVKVKRYHPYSGHEELQELRKTCARFEEQIYNAATSLFDYMRKISFKMLTIDTRPRRPMPLAYAM